MGVLKDQQLSNVLLNSLRIRDGDEFSVSVLPKLILHQIDIIFIPINPNSFHENPIEDFDLPFHNIVDIYLVHAGHFKKNMKLYIKYFYEPIIWRLFLNLFKY